MIEDRRSILDYPQFDSHFSGYNQRQDGSMSTSHIEQGTVVRHPKKPEWGLGKVLAIEGDVAKIHFKDDSGPDYRAIRTDIVSLVRADVQSDPVLDNLPPFVGDQFEVKAIRVTFGNGVERFNHLFPLGFRDPKYLSQEALAEGEAGGERDYKWNAHERFSEALGDGKAGTLLASGEIGELVDRVCRAADINLLSIYERSAIKEGLRADEGSARSYLSAVFEFIECGPEQRSFRAMAQALCNLPIAKGRARAATWPVLTLFPYLADPTRFMFLKPEPTKECAARLRFDLKYDSSLEWETYARLMILSEQLLERLHPLGARDFIDVQSFMWVVSKYPAS